jgi:hypothetical protein
MKETGSGLIYGNLSNSTSGAEEKHETRQSGSQVVSGFEPGPPDHEKVPTA